MTTMVSIQNGSNDRDVIIETLDGEGKQKGDLAMVLLPGKKSIFTIWKDNQLKIREPNGTTYRGVKVGDNVYETLNTIVGLLQDASVFLNQDVQAEANLAAEIKAVLKVYNGE